MALILDSGVDVFTIDDVARRARVSRASLYRRFASKDGLVREVLSSLLGAAVPLPDTGDLAGDLAQTYRSMIDFARTGEGNAVLRTLLAVSLRTDELASVAQQVWRDRVELATVILERARQRGEIQPDLDVTIIADAVVGSFVSRLITRPMPQDSDRVAAALVQFTLRGIMPR